jgi:hypothetical protein
MYSYGEPAVDQLHPRLVLTGHRGDEKEIRTVDASIDSDELVSGIGECINTILGHFDSYMHQLYPQFPPS